MSRLESQQYSNLRQSLRHMPPSVSPLPKEEISPSVSYIDTRQNRGSRRFRSSHHLNDLLRGKSIRNSINMGRRNRKKKGGSPSPRRGTFPVTNHDSSASDLSLSWSEDSFDQRERLPRDYAQHHVSTSRHDDGNDCRDDIIDAEVGHTSPDELTFDYDYARRTRQTFDYDYTHHMGNHHPPSTHQPHTLPTLQQHLAKKQGHSGEPRMKPVKPDDESWVNDVLDSAKAMEHALQELGQKSPHIRQPQTPSQPVAKRPSERYDICKSTIDSALMDATLRGTQEGLGGEKVSAMMALQESAWLSKSQKSLPEWVDDVLNANLDSISPEVLKELVAATVGDCSSMNNNAKRRELTKDKDFMAQVQQVSATAADGSKSLELDTLDQKQDQKKKSWPSAVDYDTRGPIPPSDDILGSSFTSLVEPQHVSVVVEDKRGPIPNDEIVDSAISASSGNKGGSVDSSICDGKKYEAASVERTEYNKGASTCSSNCSAKGEKGSVGSRKCIKGGSKGSTASTSMACQCSYSDQKSPPLTDLSSQSTVQSSQNQSTSYCKRVRSTMEYPSDEEPEKRDVPPPLRCGSSSSSFSLLGDEQKNYSPISHTKPSMGFLSYANDHSRGESSIIQAATFKMRQEVLESMRTQRIGETGKSPSKRFQPISI